MNLRTSRLSTLLLLLAAVGCGSTGATAVQRPASVFPPSGAADPALGGLCPIAGVTVGPDRVRLTLGGDVLFDTDKSDLKPAALDVLAKVKASVIDAHPDARITVEGHTDDRASDAHNQGLSERRAGSVAQWLQGQGVVPARITQVGYGEKWPRVPNTSDVNRALNRRVELVVAWGDGQAAGSARPCPTAAACCELGALNGRSGPEPGCVGKEPGPSGWGDDLGARGLEETAGVLRLNPCLTTRTAAVWITSTDEGKIARLDERDGTQLFRVPTYGRFPQRTAVAADGSVWVTNRDSGSYVHISPDGKLLCSSPLDTCTTRAAAVDSQGFAWIGCFNKRLLIQVSPHETDGTAQLINDETGDEMPVPRCKEVARVPIPDVPPYGLVADRSGVVWTGVNGDESIAKVDTVHRRVIGTYAVIEDPMIVAERGCWSPYGIAIDRDGNPWYANMGCNNVVKIDGRTGRVAGVYKGPREGMRSPRGIAVDRRGHVWVSEDAGHFVHELAPDGSFIKKIDVSSCGKDAHPLGTAADSEGDLWTAIPGAGKVIQYRTDGTILGCYPDGVKTPLFDNPYTYSDFTGAGMELASSDRGVTHVRFTHTQPVRWKLASWTLLTPAQTSLCVRARTASSVAGLASAAWSQTACPGAPTQSTVNVALDGARGGLRVADGAVLELEYTLSSSAPVASPLLSNLSVAATPAGR